jgi:hypothetical protein
MKIEMTWEISEFTLLVHYVQHTDTFTFSCQGIYELPIEYYPDQGNAPLSVKEHASLFVRGVDSDAVSALPLDLSADLSFMDRAGAYKCFFITSRIFTEEPGTARFGLPLQ